MLTEGYREQRSLVIHLFIYLFIMKATPGGWLLSPHHRDLTASPQPLHNFLAASPWLPRNLLLGVPLTFPWPPPGYPVVPHINPSASPWTLADTPRHTGSLFTPPKLASSCHSLRASFTRERDPRWKPFIMWFLWIILIFLYSDYLTFFSPTDLYLPHHLWLICFEASFLN